MLLAILIASPVQASPQEALSAYDVQPARKKRYQHMMFKMSAQPYVASGLCIFQSRKALRDGSEQVRLADVGQLIRLQVATQIIPFCVADPGLVLDSASAQIGGYLKSILYKP